MTQFLPPNLLALFAPREPLPYLPPAGKLPHEKELQPYSGLASFVFQFENPKDTPPPTRVETRDEKKERKRKERAEQVAYKLEQDLALWDPANDVNIYGDPYKTLFIARINYDTSESKLRREFDVYGPVKKVHLILNRVSGKPRGYAFIEFEHERDMHAAYKHADGKKIDGRRILVDVERGRTVKGWRPRRLGGGLGNTRKGGADVNTKYSGRDDFVGRDRAVPDDRKSLEVHSMRDERPRSPDRFRRSTRSRERSRERRRPRSRSRDRRRRSRERRRSPEREIKKEPVDETEVPPMEAGELEERKPSRDEGSRKRRRSRSRERRHSRSPRDRKRGRRSRSRERRGSKPRDRTKGEKGVGEGGPDANGDSGVFIKQEVDDKEYEGAYDASGDQYQNYDNTGRTEYPNYEDA